MSWLKNAMSKAAEVGGKNNITRSVRNYAGNVVQQAGQAVAEGAKLIQDRMSVRGATNFKQAVKRLEEVAIFARGTERVQALNRWLRALKDICEDSAFALHIGEQHSKNSFIPDDATTSPRRASSVLFYDPDSGDGPMNFCDVFLYSQALENITISMIIDAPSDEEISLLLELFELTLTGGKELHHAIISSIQDLAKVFSSYHEEVLMKREELLHFVRVAISGLKVNAEILRIDKDINHLKRQLMDEKTKENLSDGSHGDPHGEVSTILSVSSKDLKESQENVQMFSRLLDLLDRKKSILHSGEAEEAHAQKVEKLRMLVDSLTKSITKSENQVAENRNQKQEALGYRVTRAQEAEQVEKEVKLEIQALEEKRAKIEEELKNVNAALVMANARLKNAREERDQFDEASDQIISHLKIQEDELEKSMSAQKAESVVMSTWINFLKDTWCLRCSQVKQNNEAIMSELDQVNQNFLQMVISHLTSYKESLPNLLQQMKSSRESINELLQRRERVEPNSPESEEVSQERRKAEELYMLAESQAIAILSAVDTIKAEFYTTEGSISRNAEHVVKAFNSIEQIKREFETFKRPFLELEPVTQKGENFMAEKSSEGMLEKAQVHETVKEREKPCSADNEAQIQGNLDPEAELAMLESEFGKAEEGYSGQEIGGWEFDEIEEELKSGETKNS